jgi:nucleotide-binding universal stress UspA family protein
MSSGIVIGYDGSACAKEALRVGLEVAKAYGGDKVIIAFGYELNPVAGEIHDYHAAVKELATTRLQEAIAIAGGTGDAIEIEAVIVERAPAEGLAELAVERDARVIVVGTRGESPIRGALLGATAHKLLQLADRPVLVVPVDDSRASDD